MAIKNKEIEKAAKYLSERDKTLERIIKKFGKCNLQPRKDYFNALTESIIRQQLSVKAGSAIYKRFSAHFNGKPSAEALINTPGEILRTFGLSNSKVKYVKDLAAKVHNKELSFKNIEEKSSDEIINNLTKVKGIGVWTAQMFLIFTLCRLNILPVGDLGIKKSIMINYRLKKLPDENALRKVASKNGWHPYESVASWYLWRALDE